MGAGASPDTKNVALGWPLWQLWLLASVASVAANLVLWWLELSIRGISPRLVPPTSGGAEVIVFTLFGVAGASVLFAIVRRCAARPAPLFRKIALSVLWGMIYSVPYLLLMTGHQGNWLSAIVLTVMLVATAAITVGLLLSYGMQR